MTTRTGQALQVRPFASRPTLIPQLVNGEFTGKPYKAELVLLRGMEGGGRLHVWFTPDPRPHNHPWSWIGCKVLSGRYVSTEYVPDGAGGYTVRTVTLSAGDPEHRVDHHTHHQVFEVEPGTVSVMTFGPVIGDGKQWGNLVETAGGYRVEPSCVPSSFLDALRHLNPHVRPDGWADPYAHLPVPDVDELMAAAGL
ncbi:MAG TPA: hypothetical protein VFK02_28760 [Kofleriaceae bacterium]|nr:hypothetical protein [Kofleriaceae bacterium]